MTAIEGPGDVSDQYPSNIEVHRWAESQPWGHKAPRNSVTAALINAWNRAHPDRPYVKSEAHHGTPNGYDIHSCRCDRCTRAVADKSIDVYHSRAFSEGRDSARRTP